MSKRRRAGTLPSPDATTVSKIRTIISEQFELEILLKRRELYVIQEEIAYGRHLQNLILAASQCEPSSLLLGGTSRFEKSVSASNDETLPAIPDELIDPLGRRTRTASGILPSRDVRDIEKSVFALRDDGIFVRYEASMFRSSTTLKIDLSCVLSVRLYKSCWFHQPLPKFAQNELSKRGRME